MEHPRAGPERCLAPSQLPEPGQLIPATPHNGHPNSFAALMEILDPQRFVRGMAIEPTQLEPVVVRRLKEDLRGLGQSFPERRIEPIVIAGLPENAPELVLAARLAGYRELRRNRLKAETASRRAQGELVWIGLQQRSTTAGQGLRSLPPSRRALPSSHERDCLVRGHCRRQRRERSPLL
jgi:hypothetical protein